MSAGPDLQELRTLAEAVATEAGALLADGLDEVRTDVGTKTTGTDMVTEMDRASEALIDARLLTARPEDGILGEEGADRTGTSGVRWVVDPLDGTTNYLYGFPGFNVSIAAEVDGEPLVGVVYDIVRAELFSAAKGLGATRNGTPIRASQATELGHSLVGTGFSYDPERRRKQADVLVRVLPYVRDVRRQGAAAVDLCSVACGRLDAYYEKGLAPWDLAAGEVIAIEAGAVVEDDGCVIAAAPGIASGLQALVVGAGARDA